VSEGVIISNNCAGAECTSSSASMASSAAATGGNDQQAQPPPITRQPSANKKFTVDDFEYGGMLGEGSYAKVWSESKREAWSMNLIP